MIAIQKASARSIGFAGLPGWLKPVGLLVLLTIWAWAALLQPGYFLNAHDARHTLMFLLEFDANIRAGVLYPRWAPDWGLGYGYPLFTFYAPLAYFVAEALHLLGFGLVESVKGTYLLGFILAALSMYLYAGSLFGRTGGLIAALVYTYAPYHLVDIYVRSALAEFWSFVWFPLILWAFHRLVLGPRERVYRLRAIALAGLAYAGLMLTHNGTAFIFAGIIGPYCLLLLILRRRAEQRLPWPEVLGGLAAGILMLLISAIFWLPLFAERTFVDLNQWIPPNYDYHRHFVYLFQFLAPLWEYGYSDGLQGHMPLQLGLAPLALALAGLAGVSLLKRQSVARAGQGSERSLLYFWAALGLAVTLMTMSISAPLWATLPIVALLQFPWRILSMTTLIMALLAGGIIYLQRSSDRAASGGDSGLTRSAFLRMLPVLAIVVAFSYQYSVPQFTTVEADDLRPVVVINFDLVNPPERTAVVAWTKVHPQDSPLVAQYKAGTPLIKASVPDAQVSAGPVTAISSQVEFDAPHAATLTWYTYYYPGWHAYLDGQEVAVTPDNNHGLITMPVPAGTHTATIRYSGTPVHLVAAALTIAGLVLALLLLSYRPRLPFVRRISTAES